MERPSGACGATGVSGFELDDEAVVDEEIHPALPYADPLVADLDGRLADEGDLAETELDGQRLLIDAFQIARSQLPIDLYRSTDHGVGEVVVTRVGLLGIGGQFPYTPMSDPTLCTVLNQHRFLLTLTIPVVGGFLFGPDQPRFQKL